MVAKKVFICYETKTGLDCAKHVKEALEEKNKSALVKSAFVANEDINAGEVWREVIDEAIKTCNYFVVIVTVLSFEAKEVEREIKLAGSLPSLKGNMILCKEESIDRSRLSELPIISELQQIDFESKEELARKLIHEISKRESAKITSGSIPSDIYRCIDRLTSG